MHTFVELLLECQAQRAWDATVDFEGRARHSERVKEATVVEGGGLSEGKHLRLRIDRRRFTLAVAEMTEPSVLRLTMRGPLFQGQHRYSVSERDGGSAVRIDADYGGPLGSVFGMVMKRSVRRDLTDELDVIRRQAAAP